MKKLYVRSYSNVGRIMTARVFELIERKKMVVLTKLKYPKREKEEEIQKSIKTKTFKLQNK
jgi:hypothetical protein